MEEQNELLMPFFDSSESFTNGFECGQIWEKLQNGEKLDKYLVHRCNIEQIKKIAEIFMTKISVRKTSEDEWCTITTKDFDLVFFDKK